MQCPQPTSPYSYPLALPTPRQPSQFPRRITHYVLQNPSTPSTLNCFYILPVTGILGTPSTLWAHQAEYLLADQISFSPSPDCSDIIPISRLDIHSTRPACHRHLALQDSFNCLYFRPTTRPGIYSSGSGQEVHLIGTQPDVNPTRTQPELSHDISRIRRTLAGLLQFGSSKDRKVIF